MFYKKHAVKRTIWNFFIYLHNWNLAVPVVAFSAQTAALGEKKIISTL